MTTLDDGQGPQLPAELAAALQRATTQTLRSLHSLRVALREHVHSERARGVSLVDIDARLRDMIDVAAGDTDGPAYSVERVAELKTQVIKWSEAVFSRRAPTLI